VRPLLAILLVVACHPSEKRVDVDRGRQLIAQYGCNVCHDIPGIAGPHGSIGPTLQGIASRPMISNGVVQNTPANLAQFIQRPASLNPSTSMPGLDIPAADAKEIASYLGTLR